MNSPRYHPLPAALHWIMFILIATALAAIEVKGDIPKGDPLRSSLQSLHVLAGQLVFLFVLFRLAVRFTFSPPPDLPAPKWQTGCAHLVHLLLYLMMLALPLSGILIYQAGGKDVHFFGMLIPQILTPDQGLKGAAHEFHEFMGNAIYLVVGVHIFAALWHQLVMKDGILLRMLPWKK